MLFLCLYFCLSFCRIVQTIPLISGAVSISGKESERAVLGYTYNRPFVTVVRRKGNIFPITTVRMMKMRVCLGQTTDEMPVRDMSVLLDNVDASSGSLKGARRVAILKTTDPLQAPLILPPYLFVHYDIQ